MGISVFSAIPPTLMAQTQVFVNTDWFHNFGAADTIEWSASTLDLTDHLVTVANTLQSGEGANVLISRFDPDQILLWQKQWNGAADLGDYGVAVTTDNSQNIYVAGATRDAAGDLDIVIIKYNSSGVWQWEALYDGPAGKDDIPSAIIHDNLDDVSYIAATSRGDSSGADYLLLKYDGGGGLDWARRYDHVGLDEHAVAMEFSHAGDIAVFGASAASALNQDYTVLLWDEDGIPQDTARQALPGLGTDKPTAIARDLNGNFYITGTHLDSGQLDIRTLKLSPALTQVWSVDHDGYGADDEPLAIGVSSSGEVYIAGYVTDGSGDTRFITIKYDATGTEEWANEESADPGYGSAATGLYLGSGEEVYVTGQKEGPTGTDLYTVSYDPDGSKNWEESHPGAGEEIGGEIQGSSQGLYITGKSFTGSNYQYLTLRYTALYHGLEMVYDTANKPLYLGNEVLVRFSPWIIDSPFVNNPDLEYGLVNEVITDSAAISMLDQKLQANGNVGNWKLIRIFHGLTTDKTHFPTRLGRQQEVPTFWTAFRLVIPETQAESDSMTDPHQYADSLESMPQAYVFYAHPNYILQTQAVPNDPRYSLLDSLNEQKSLFNQDTIRGHINAQAAWDFLESAGEAVGDSNIVVGVFDSGISEGHEDFYKPLGGPWSGGSKVLNGVTYTGGKPHPLIPIDSFGHGTSVAGIIGAARNNQAHIAGIAGGEYDSTQNPGVYFRNIKIVASEPGDQGVYMKKPIIMSSATAALLYCLDSANDLQFDIMNNSWGGLGFTQNDFNLMRDAFRLAHQCEIVIINARGNADLASGDSIFVAPAIPSNDPDLPTRYYDDWGISVGASDEDGIRQEYDFANPDPDNPYSSHYGKEMDLMAPGVTDLVTSLAYLPNPTGWSSSTRVFNGTSAATPHVSGVAALLMSYTDARKDFGNEPLAPEDVEHLVEYGAYRKDSAYYEAETGWGLLDAHASLLLVEKPRCRVVHYEALPAPADKVKESGPVSILLPYPYHGSQDSFVTGLLTLVNVYRFRHTVQHQNLSPHAYLPNLQHSRPPYWIRNSGSNLWDQYYKKDTSSRRRYVMPETWVQFVGTPTIDSATIEGYLYEVMTSGSQSTFIPNGADSLPRLAYSLLVCDSVGFPTTAEPSVWKQAHFVLYPNPAQDKAHLAYQLDTSGDLSISLLDIQGHKLRHLRSGGQVAGHHRFSFSLQDLAPGVYLLRVFFQSQKHYFKLIKQ